MTHEDVLDSGRQTSLCVQEDTAAFHLLHLVEDELVIFGADLPEVESFSEQLLPLSDSFLWLLADAQECADRTDHNLLQSNHHDVCRPHLGLKHGSQLKDGGQFATTVQGKYLKQQGGTFGRLSDHELPLGMLVRFELALGVQALQNQNALLLEIVRQALLLPSLE